MYRIMARYKNMDEEEVDTADTKDEATFLLHEYTMAYDNDFTVWIVLDGDES